MNVLLSIRPEFASAIWRRDKRFEYRRRIFDVFRYNVGFVYTTAPVSLVTGKFTIADVVVGRPTEIWTETNSYAGIDEERFFEYFSGRDTAFAISIADPEQFEVPLDLTSNFGLSRPPQSYAFVDNPTKHW